jgi:hypothetical protein
VAALLQLSESVTEVVIVMGTDYGVVCGYVGLYAPPA